MKDSHYFIIMFLDIINIKGAKSPRKQPPQAGFESSVGWANTPTMGLELLLLVIGLWGHEVLSNRVVGHEGY